MPIATTNLKAVYSFEAGALTTDGKGTHTLTAVGGTPAAATGILGGAAEFTRVSISSGQFYTTPNTSDLQVPSDTLVTVAGWVYLNNNGFYQNIVSKGSFGAGTCEYSLYISPTNFLIFGVVGSNSSLYQVIMTTNAIPLSTWTFVCGMWDGTNLKASVNGGTFTTIAGNGTNIGTHSLAIANGSSTVYYPLSGRLDSIGIWIGTALSQSDVTYLYNSGVGLAWNSAANQWGTPPPPIKRRLIKIDNSRKYQAQRR